MLADNIDQIPLVTYTGARWLKTLAAIEYSSIGRHQLKRLAKTGAIIGYPDPDNKRGDWIFDRESIDRYRIRQMPPQVNLNQKVLELARKAGI